ncbi:hypothetical protein [Pseudactinotalea sp.]|uniref:hypothetical protein n=1 Tax=Pseudactinotalea sp. TaxID=1926260 RepID=UPI003B3B47EC
MSLLAPALDGIGSVRDKIESWYLDSKRATYGLSFSRIVVGIAVLGILVTNFGTRHAVWGPGSAWADQLRARSVFGSLSDLWSTSSPTLFTMQYVLLMAVAVAVVVGWRTRASIVVLVVGMTALVERNPLVGDQGDNIARIGLIFLAVASSSEHWSLDARRRRRALAAGAPSGVLRRLGAGLPVLPTWLGATVHNLALSALALQVFILYLASALYKVQGGLWQGGTALYYPLSLHEYGVFPWLNHLLISNGVILTAATYFAVLVQLFFVPALIHPYTRRIAVLAVIAMHIGIAVLMGLPWFSLSMIAFDGIFVSSVTYRRLEAWAGERARLARIALEKRRSRAPASATG